MNANERESKQGCVETFAGCRRRGWQGWPCKKRSNALVRAVEKGVD
jgi:hypothetical protein